MMIANTSAALNIGHQRASYSKIDEDNAELVVGWIDTGYPHG